MHFMTNGGNALHRLKALPVSPVLIPMQMGVKNVFHAYSNFRSVKSYCEEHGIDLIHTHHRYPEFIASAVSRQLNLATVTTAHSIVHGFKVLSFRSDKIVAVSNAVRDSLIQQFGIDASKIAVMHNCVEPFRPCSDEELADRKRTLGIPDNDKVILYLGRFDRIKGVKYLINAYRRISTERTDLTLLLVGGAQAAIEKDEASRIIRVPAQDATSVFYQLSDLVVLPSEQDPFPYTMLETGLAGKPFVGSRVGGIAEFIEEGTDGLLFTPRDEAELADRMLEVLNDDSKAASLGSNLRRKVWSLPTCEQYGEKLEELYEHLLSQNRSLHRT
jgi:glycosyltransferase involved in cell wall biosynthesis